MTPEDARQKLAAVDAELAATLREMGLREDEIATVLDPRLSADERKRRTDEALSRVVAAQLSDPSSPLFNAAMDRAVGELEANGPEIRAEVGAHKRARARRRLVIGGAVVLAALGTGGYFALRPPNPCVAMLGPLAELESLSKLVLVAEKPVGPYRGSPGCSIMVVEKDRFAPGHIGNPIVILKLEHAAKSGDSDARQHLESTRHFASVEKVAVGEGGWLFVAGDAPTPSTDDLMRTAQRNARPAGRRGLSYDPIGAALASLPESHHVVLVRGGSLLLEISFERHAFTAEMAKAGAEALYARAPTAAAR